MYNTYAGGIEDSKKCPLKSSAQVSVPSNTSADCATENSVSQQWHVSISGAGGLLIR